METTKSVFEVPHHPFLQGGIIVVVAVVFILVGTLLSFLNIIETSIKFPYMSTAAFLFLFAIFNSIISLSAKDLNIYFLKSFVAYSVLALVCLGLGWLITGKSVGEVASYKWIIFVITFAYLTFLSIAGMMRRLGDFLRNDEERNR